MRIVPAALLSALATAGCVGVGGQAGGPIAGPSDGVRIADVNVRPSRVAVRMTDGATCVGERPEGTSSGWSGVTGGCPYQLPFVVTFARGGSPSRFAVERPFGTQTPEGTPGPRAEVFVTDVDGVRRLFVRPLPERLFETGV